MSTSSAAKSGSLVSKRGIGIAGFAAIVGCAACCALPLLAAAGFASGAVAALSWLFSPGAELLVGGGVFVAVLAVMAARNRLRSPSARLRLP